MSNTRLRLLVVDDEPALRTTFSMVFSELGYDVRTAEDGFSALSQMRNEAPDILLSDLNMPGMSGFELLSVVRRRFPAMPVIAMSGAFPSGKVPHGIPADCFYQKGSGMELLLKSLTKASKRETPDRQNAPIWFSQNGHDSAGEPYITMACPECLRGFPLALCSGGSALNETNCIYCGVSIQYAIAEARSV